MKLLRGAVALALSAAAAAAAAETPAGALEEVVVTAQKREQSLQEVGISVAAYSAAELSARGVESSIDVAQITPGVHVSGSIGGQNSQFTVRGVTQADFADTLEAPVAVYVDNTYIAMQQGQVFGLFDLDRVEVLKGPQGTLFGRNATGGLVHFVTARPTREPAGFVSVTYGANQQNRVEAAVGGPLSDSIAVRVSGLYNEFDPIIRNSFPGAGDFWNDDTRAGRVQLEYRASDAFSARISAFAGKSDIGLAPYLQTPVVPVFDAQGRQVNTIVASPTETRIGIGPGGIATDSAGVPTIARRPVAGGDLFGYCCSNSKDFRTSENIGTDSGNTFKTRGASLFLDWNLGGLAIASISDFKKFEKSNINDPDAGPVDLFGFISVANTRQWSEELRFSGSSGAWNWVGGAYYLDVDAKVPREGITVSSTSVLNAALGAGGAAIDLRDFAFKRTKSASLFGQVEYQLADAWKLIGGARVINEKQKFNYGTGIYLGGTDTLIAPGRTFADSFNDTLWAAKVQLEWTPVDGLLVYGGVNRGVKAGAFNQPLFINGLPDSQIPYGPETLTSFEVGFKSTLLDGRMRLNGSTYYYDYKDYQVFEIRVADNVVRNAKARNYGAELDMTFKPVDNATLGLSASALDAQVKNIVLNGITRTVDTPYAPGFQASAYARVSWPLGTGEMALNADVSHTGSFYYQIFNFDAQRVDAYTLGNVRLTYAPNANWEFRAFVKNVTDERYVRIGFDLGTLSGGAQTAYGLPRWWGAEVRYSF
ncbi:MAG: TonB-dependent receptor [Steroidobacteraceae bacterium]|jgi:iron complex outermembrane receptor protein|nr:TonB-dependent receptor [Steroidobacteraceae bacterium]